MVSRRGGSWVNGLGHFHFASETRACVGDTTSKQIKQNKSAIKLYGADLTTDNSNLIAEGVVIRSFSMLST